MSPGFGECGSVEEAWSKSREAALCELRLETVRKGVRGRLRRRIRTTSGGPNGPKTGFTAVHGAAPRALVGLFGQFQGEVLRIHLPGTWVNRKSKGWVSRGNQRAARERRKNCSEKVETHPTNTLASPDESAMNSWRSSSQNSPSTHLGE
jgi:hypothetical protein